jgi:hypothetical protein
VSTFRVAAFLREAFLTVLGRAAAETFFLDVVVRVGLLGFNDLRDEVALVGFFDATARFALGRTVLPLIVRSLTEDFVEDLEEPEADLLNPFATGLLICGVKNSTRRLDGPPKLAGRLA